MDDAVDDGIDGHKYILFRCKNTHSFRGRPPLCNRAAKSEEEHS